MCDSRLLHRLRLIDAPKSTIENHLHFQKHSRRDKTLYMEPRPCDAPDSVAQHRQAAPKKLRAAVMTLSTTRTKDNDLGGKYLCETLGQAGHEIVWYEVLK